MKKKLQITVLSMLLMLLLTTPNLLTAQTQKSTSPVKTNNFEKYWSINTNIGANLFYGDLNVYRWYPVTNNKNMWKLGYGITVNRQFTPVFGLRGQLLNGKLSGTKRQYDNGSPCNQYFDANIFEYNINATINFSNLIFKYKPERKFSVYGFLGIGMANWETEKKDLYTDAVIARNGYDKAGGTFQRTNETVIPAGLGINYSLNDNWEINLEGSLRPVNNDILDATEGGFDYDIYSYNSLGVTYKLTALGDSKKKMSKNYKSVIYKTTPEILETKGNTIEVTVTGTFPEKYFGKKNAMFFSPELKYKDGGSYKLKPVTIQGEKVIGDGIVVGYQNGGTFTYKEEIPYSPEMNNSELVVTPVVYKVKKTLNTYESADEIMKNEKYVELPEILLAKGVIHSCKNIVNDQNIAIAENGYEKETIITKKADIYFAKNLAYLNMRLPLNKTAEAINNLKASKEFIKQGWKIKDIDINAWASPEGEESFNEGLSERRAKTANKYMYSLFKKLAKNKKSLVKIKHPEKEIIFNSYAKGEDWEGFMTAVKNSNLTDKNIILNVVNSQTDLSKREEEIRNMTIVYKEIEDDILPPLRRAEINVNCYEPKKTDEEIAKLSTTYPDSLDVKELLYAATLTNDLKTKYKIYKSATAIYPKCWKAFNNTGAILIGLKDFAQANIYMEKANELAPNNAKIINNLGVIAAANKDYKKAEALFTEAKKLGFNEDYNLGTICIVKGDYNKALLSLKDAKCNYNNALAQLLAGNIDKAKSIIDCAPKNAQSYYLKAIIGARTNNENSVIENLKKVIEIDPSYKEKLNNDAEFTNYFDSAEFQKIVK